MCRVCRRDTLTSPQNERLSQTQLANAGLQVTSIALESSEYKEYQKITMAALGIGGETAMTLWTMVAGSAAALFLFALARPYMGLNWSLGLTLVFVSTPAVIYGAGTGQVEVKNAMFILASVYFLVLTQKTGCWKYAGLAGLAAGFFAASKYTGLIICFVGAIVLLIQRTGLRPIFAYSVAALVSGGQWYMWNFWATGDPIFPMLFELISYPASTPWNEDIHAFYQASIFDKNLEPSLLSRNPNSLLAHRLGYSRAALRAHVPQLFAVSPLQRAPLAYDALEPLNLLCPTTVMHGTSLKYGFRRESIAALLRFPKRKILARDDETDK